MASQIYCKVDRHFSVHQRLYLTTCLSRFVDWFVGLENGEESFRLDKDLGLFTHLILPPLDADMDSGHTVSLHWGYLQYEKQKNGSLVELLQSSSPLTKVCLSD